jgi:hypothetical protein
LNSASAVHVLADYGTSVEAELAVFAFIAGANDDPRGFSLLAMVVSLFETRYLRADAGLFERLAELPLDEAIRRRYDLTMGPAGISPTQPTSGQQRAPRLGAPYDSYGATP